MRVNRQQKTTRNIRAPMPDIHVWREKQKGHSSYHGGHSLSDRNKKHRVWQCQPAKSY